MILVGCGLLNDPTNPGESPAGTPSASAEPSISLLPALSLPTYGQRNRPGEYGWTLARESRGGMLNVVGDGDDFRQTQIVFSVGSIYNDCFPGIRGAQPDSMMLWHGDTWYDAWYVEPFEAESPRDVMFLPRGGETTRAYAIPIEDRMLCVYLSWDPTSTPDEIDAAHSVISSIRALPFRSGVRIVFTTEGGWDTG